MTGWLEGKVIRICQNKAMLMCVDGIVMQYSHAYTVQWQFKNGQERRNMAMLVSKDR